MFQMVNGDCKRKDKLEQMNKFKMPMLKQKLKSMKIVTWPTFR